MRVSFEMIRDGESRVPTPQQILATAKELHDSYRAANKSFGGPQPHDHGFTCCTNKGKVYFIRRALLVLKQRQAVVPF
jgi:hypothetical protein